MAAAERLLHQNQPARNAFSKCFEIPIGSRFANLRKGLQFDGSREMKPFQCEARIPGLHHEQQF